MPHLSTTQSRIYYEIEGKGKPLVLVAGYSADLGLWTRVRDELARHFQLILFDNRGIGRSEYSKKPFTLEDMAEDVIEIIKALELKKPHILGHSMGGAIVQIIAHRYPQMVDKTIVAQSLIKIAPTTRAAIMAQLHLYQDKIPIRRIAETAIPWIFSNGLINNASFCEGFLKLQEENPYPPTFQGLSKQFEALVQFDSHSWYSKINTAPLILSSDEDRFCPFKHSEEMAANIPYAKLHIFDGVGHIAPIERPEEFCSVVRNFLKPK